MFGSVEGGREGRKKEKKRKREKKKNQNNNIERPRSMLMCPSAP